MSISGGMLTLHVQGADKLWALKEFPANPVSTLRDRNALAGRPVPKREWVIFSC